jgi:hypothetical protein
MSPIIRIKREWSDFYLIRRYQVKQLAALKRHLKLIFESGLEFNRIF